MAKILEYRELPLADLLVDKGQVRTQDVDKEVDQLAESIRRQGLLQPIVVCAAAEEGKWEILSGQRRHLAHKLLGRKAINAAVLDVRVDEAEAKAISITENLVRRNLSGPELIDGITFLYNKYGSAKAVHDSTGIPYHDVRQYVKYPRLRQGLKKLVDEGAVDLKVALSAQDVSERLEGKVSERDLGRLAKGMERMPKAQRAQLSKAAKANPKASVDELLSGAESSDEVSQIVVTLPKEAHEALKRLAESEGATQDAVASSIIVERLRSQGLVEAPKAS